jgi:hypothetical protein
MYEKYLIFFLIINKNNAILYFRFNTLKKKLRRIQLQYASIKAYSLTDFKKFLFSGNRYFLRTEGNQRAVLIVLAIKSVFIGYFMQDFRKTVRTLEENTMEFLQKHCDAFTGTL